MKRVCLLLLTGMISIVFWGCGDQGQVTGPSEPGVDGSVYQRPQFIDTRPYAVIEDFVNQASPEYLCAINTDKKPPKPPPTPVDPNPDPAHKYAYIVGISDYEGTQNDLQYCDDDAIDWKNYLQSQGFTVQMDLDQQATANNIQAGLQWLADSAVPGDEIAFIYSGHGTKYNQYGSCIISTDLYYLTHDYVMEYVNAANNTKKMVSVDACMVGNFHDNAEAGMVVATASTNSYSYDGEPWMENGVWTYYYIEDLVDNGEIFNENASAYAKINMKAWAKQYNVRVTPATTDMYDGYFDI